MTDRDNHLWLQLWREQRTAFHQKKVNLLLTRFWAGLGHPPRSRVFVPLCGKSLDMIWLAGQGHDVIGVELSPIAVKAFFKENGLRPVKRRTGRFTLWKHGNITILCGDFFSLKKSDLGHIDTVYDRAALTALPEDIREHYVAQLQLIVPETTNVFLLTIEDTEDHGTASASPCVDKEVETLFSEGFEIELLHVEGVMEMNPVSPNETSKRADYKVYRLSNRQENAAGHYKL